MLSRHAITWSACQLASWLLLGPLPSAYGQLRTDEQVILFPTAARQNDAGDGWIVPVHGWIFEPEAGDLVRGYTLRLLQRMIGDGLSDDERKLLSARCARFLVDNERGKQLAVRIGDRPFPLPRSDIDGHFQGELVLPADLVARVAKGPRLTLTVVTPADDERIFSGTVLLIPPQGISVISDIDDTIKISHVTDRRKLLASTFTREFEAVPGMAEAYRRWGEAGAVFHYVSSSPWQLYEPLAAMASAGGFPPATFHLKRFRLKDSSFWNLFADPLVSKPPVIEGLLRAYPQRRFVLVGDSGERDPEVYAKIAGRFPQQILRIDIRDVTGEPRESERYRKTFAAIPPEKWHVFTDPATLELPK